MSTQSTCWTASKNLTELCSCFQIQRKKGRRTNLIWNIKNKMREREKKKNHHRWGASRWRNNVGEGNQNCRGWISAAPSRRTQNEGELTGRTWGHFRPKLCFRSLKIDFLMKGKKVIVFFFLIRRIQPGVNKEVTVFFFPQFEESSQGCQWAIKKQAAFWIQCITNFMALNSSKQWGKRHPLKARIECSKDDWEKYMYSYDEKKDTLQFSDLFRDENHKFSTSFSLWRLTWSPSLLAQFSIRPASISFNFQLRKPPGSQ